MTAAAQLLLDAVGEPPAPRPQRRRKPPARAAAPADRAAEMRPMVEEPPPGPSPADRAAALALAIAGAVVTIQSGRGRGGLRELREQARRDLQELELLLGVRDVALPPVARERGSAARRAWQGFAGPPDEEQEDAALAVWAALGEPAEAYLLTWREALGMTPRLRQKGIHHG